LLVVHAENFISFFCEIKLKYSKKNIFDNTFLLTSEEPKAILLDKRKIIESFCLQIDDIDQKIKGESVFFVKGMNFQGALTLIDMLALGFNFLTLKWD